MEIVGPTSHFFVSQCLRLHYVDWGNPTRPTLVLVHGNRDHARSWDRVARALRHDWHVVALDLRGHGDSAWVRGGPYAIADNVLDLANLIDALGPGPVVLVGHSLGGSVVAMYAGVYPERVSKLVLVDSVGIWLREQPIADIFAIDGRHPEKLLDLLFHDVDHPLAKLMVAALSTERASQDELEEIRKLIDQVEARKEEAPQE